MINLSKTIHITDFGVSLKKNRKKDEFCESKLFYIPCKFIEFDTIAERFPFKPKTRKFRVMVNLRTLKNSFITDGLPECLARDVEDDKILERHISDHQLEEIVKKYASIRIPKIFGLKKPEIKIYNSLELYRPVYVFKTGETCRIYNAYTGKEEKNVI